jgi:hypothetical protein
MFLVAASQRRGVGDERPAVRRLPEKVWGRDSDRNKNGGPWLPTREQAALRRGEEPERDRDQVGRDGIFGEKRDSADRPAASHQRGSSSFSARMMHRAIASHASGPRVSVSRTTPQNGSVPLARTVRPASQRA